MTAPSAPVTPDPPPQWRELSDWERRLILTARELRARRKSCMLIVRFDGPAMTLATDHVLGRGTT